MRVGEAKQRDVGKRRARIEPEAMEFLKVEPGDMIEIIAKRSSCAIVCPADDENKAPDVIRIDGQTRKNVGVGINDLVNVRNVIANTAKSVVLMQVNENVKVDKKSTDLVKKRQS